MLVGGLKTEICVLVLSVRAKLSSAFITQRWYQSFPSNSRIVRHCVQSVLLVSDTRWFQT